MIISLRNVNVSFPGLCVTLSFSFATNNAQRVMFWPMQMAWLKIEGRAEAWPEAEPDANTLATRQLMQIARHLLRVATQMLKGDLLQLRFGRIF